MQYTGFLTFRLLNAKFREFEVIACVLIIVFFDQNSVKLFYSLSRFIDLTKYCFGEIGFIIFSHCTQETESFTSHSFVAKKS